MCVMYICVCVFVCYVKDFAKQRFLPKIFKCKKEKCIHNQRFSEGTIVYSNELLK